MSDVIGQRQQTSPTLSQTVQKHIATFDMRRFKQSLFLFKLTDIDV